MLLIQLCFYLYWNEINEVNCDNDVNEYDWIEMIESMHFAFQKKLIRSSNICKDAKKILMQKQKSLIRLNKAIIKCIWFFQYNLYGSTHFTW